MLETDTVDESLSLQAYFPVGPINGTSECDGCCGAGGAGRRLSDTEPGRDGWARDVRFSQGPENLI